MSDSELGQGLSCFIVGPIGDRLEPVGTPGKMAYENATQMWEHVFEPACNAFGLSPVRADKISEAGDIPEQIFTYLRDADVVIADVTGGNANVMYELGLRHTRDKITIQIGQHEKLPFDVTTIRTIKFRRTDAGLIDARNSLIESLREALQGNFKPVTATRVWNDLSTLSAADLAEASALSFVSDDPADIADDDDQDGRLELLAKGEEAMEKFVELLSEFSESMTSMNEIAVASTAELNDAENFAEKLTRMKQFADRLGVPASEMSETSSEYLTRVEQIDIFVKILAEEWAKGEDPDATPEQIETFIASVEGMASSSGETNVTFTEMIATVRDMRKWSKLLGPVSRSLEHSINAIIQGNAIIMTWPDLLRAARDERDEHEGGSDG